MRGISRNPADPEWAQPGRWDWTVVLSFLSALLLLIGMLLPPVPLGFEHLRTAAHPQRIETLAGLHRMIGPAAWFAFDDWKPPRRAVKP